MPRRVYKGMSTNSKVIGAEKKKSKGLSYYCENVKLASHKADIIRLLFTWNVCIYLFIFH